MAKARAIVKSLDHLVLTCRDVVATSSWYATHLGMRPETFVAASDPSVTDLKSLAAGFEKDGIKVLEGGDVVNRTGARGPIRSIYVRDPDGNLVELSHY